MKITELGRSLERKTGSIRNCIERAPSRPRWFGWPATCVPGPPRRPTRSSPPPAACASCRNRAGHIGNQLLPARLGSPHCPADVGRWRSGSQVRYQGELLLIRQKAPSWQQVGRVRANTRVQAGTSEAAGALNEWRRTSTSTAGGAPAAVRGRGGGSAHREKLFGRDAETCGMYRWLRDNGLPEGFQILCLSCNESKGTGERCTLAYRQQEALLCL